MKKQINVSSLLIILLGVFITFTTSCKEDEIVKKDPEIT